jgi:hypothetical protein
LRGPLKLVLDVPAQVSAPAPRRRTLLPWVAAWLMLSAGLYLLSARPAAGTAEETRTAEANEPSPKGGWASQSGEAAATVTKPARAATLHSAPGPLDTRALKFEAVRDDSNLKVFAGGARRLAITGEPGRSSAVPDPPPSADESAEDP